MYQAPLMYSLPTFGEFPPSHTRVLTRTHTHTPHHTFTCGDTALLSAPAGQETRPQQLVATTGLRSWGRCRAPRPSWVAPNLRFGVSSVCVPTLTSTPSIYVQQGRRCPLPRGEEAPESLFTRRILMFLSTFSPSENPFKARAQRSRTNLKCH